MEVKVRFKNYVGNKITLPKTKMKEVDFMAESNNIKILRCKKIAIRNLNEIEEKLNNWFLLNKEKKVRFITQSYIPVYRTPVDKDEKYEETRAFHLYTIFFES